VRITSYCTQPETFASGQLPAKPAAHQEVVHSNVTQGVESQHEEHLGGSFIKQLIKPTVLDDLLLSIGNYIPFTSASSQSAAEFCASSSLGS